MAAVEHSPSFAKTVGVPQSVGADFMRADDKAGITKNPGRHVATAKRRATGHLTHHEFNRL